MHNKHSHSVNHIALKKTIFNKLLKKADYILTHSSEGISYGDSIIPGSQSRIKYLPHPVKDRRDKIVTEKKWDILIWGTLSPYKGIVEFLKLLNEQNVQHNYKILIIGKSVSKDYYSSLLSHSNENMVVKDEFIDNTSLKVLINQSKIVLFTYATSSILSSGALMDSIGFGANVIGPDVGAFSDLAKEGIIRIYKNQDEIIPLINSQLNGRNSYSQETITSFLYENSWDKYAENVHHIIQ